VRKAALLTLLLPILAQAQLVPGFLNDATYPAPSNPASAWTALAVGTGTCESFHDDSAGTLTIEATGANMDNGCFVYQAVATPDVQLTAKLVSQTGTNIGLASIIVKNAADQTSSFCSIGWGTSLTQALGRYKQTDGGGITSGIVGDTGFTLPVYYGLTFDDSLNHCEMYESDVDSSPSVTTEYQGVPQPHVTYAVTAATGYAVGFFVHNSNDGTANTVVFSDITIGSSLTLIDNQTIDPDANLVFRSDFDDGTVDISNDAFTNFNTMYGKCDLGLDRTPVAKVACPDTVQGRCWDGQTCDGSETHAYSYSVVASDNGVTPRAGGYMMRYETHLNDFATGNPPGVTNERVQLKIDSDATAVQLVHNKTYWVGLSRYMPSVEYSPTYTDTWFQFTNYPEASNDHDIIIQYRPQTAGDTTATSFRARCNYYTAPNTKNTCVTSSTGVGYQNPVDAYVDEWIDFRFEIKFHDTNGVLKMWTRRAEVTNDYTLEVDYSGPMGWYDSSKTYRFDFQLYGGGGFPLVIYYDEIRFASEDTGVMTDVDPVNLQ
jgi:hypothetical protein